MPARYKEGDVHAFLVLRSDAGRVIASGDAVNMRAGKVWRTHLSLRFRDGSVHDEVATYTQDAKLHLLNYRLQEKGPSFPQAADLRIDTASGNVTYRDPKDASGQVKTEHMDLPADLADGIMPMVLQNFPAGAAPVKVSYVAATPKPRLVTFEISRDGQGSFAVGGSAGKASQFRIHVRIGGIAGFLAPIVGKDPPDMLAWTSAGDAPTFLRLNGFLFLGGPIWHLEVSGPSWK